MGRYEKLGSRLSHSGLLVFGHDHGIKLHISMAHNCHWIHVKYSTHVYTSCHVCV